MEIAGCADWSGRSAQEALSAIVEGSAIREKLESGQSAALAVLEPVAGARADEELSATGKLGRVCLVADARIDNLDQLRARLEGNARDSLGVLLIRAYLKWGDSFPDRLVGDFALVLWDGDRQRVVAARDPFGVRPLFYRKEHSRICLASVTSRVRRTFVDTPKLDDQMLVEHLVWKYKSLDNTFFRDIKRVRAGHVLVATSEEANLIRYWFPPAPRPDLADRTKESIFEEARDLFARSVERRIRSALPVVLHVSGGLDSSSIAMAANGLSRSGRCEAPLLIGASAVYPGLACDEGPFIEAVARSVQFSIERWDATQSDSIDLIDPSPDAPGARMTTTAGYDGDVVIAQRHGAAVILSGFGGDDLMSAFGFTKDLLVSGAWRDGLAALWPKGISIREGLKRLKLVAGHFVPPLVRGLRSRLTADVPDWLSPRLRTIARDLAADDIPDLHFTSEVRRRTWFRLNAAYARRSIGSMQDKAASLGAEYRFPFLDRELVEFILNLPPSCLPGPVRYARIHREAFGPILPPEVANRLGKAELTPAVINRVRRALPLIDGMLSNGPWASEDYVDRQAARRFVKRITATGSDAAPKDWWQVWRMATVEAWMRGALGYTAPKQGER